MSPEKKPLTNLNQQIMEGYYTAQEAQKRLGMTKDMFNHYVVQGTINRQTFVGKHGYYKKTEIDALAEKIEALLLTAEIADLQYRPVGRLDGQFNKQQMLDDLDQEGRLAIIHFGEKYGRMPERVAARRRYVEVNPDSTYYLFNYKTLVASINIVPLKHAAILEFVEGKRGWQFPDEMIEQYEPGHPLELIIIDCMVTTLASPAKREHYASTLLRHLAGTMGEWGKQGIEIRSIDACGGTELGKRILESAGFEDLGDKNGRVIYHLEVDDSDLKLLRPYKRALEIWKQQHP